MPKSPGLDQQRSAHAVLGAARDLQTRWASRTAPEAEGFESIVQLAGRAPRPECRSEDSSRKRIRGYVTSF